MKQRTLAMMTGFEQYTSKTPASHISGGDGAGGAVGRVVRAGGAALSPAWEGAAAGGSGAHAADLLFAAVVQPVGPGGGRGAVRLRGMRQFVGIDLGCEPVPDETTVCKFRHLLEAHQLGEVIRECAPQARDCTHRRYRYKDGVDEVERAKNRSKSTVRSKVEHVFAVMKLKFGFVKLRFRGLKEECHPTVRGVRAGESVLGA